MMKTKDFSESVADELVPMCSFAQCPRSPQSVCLSGPQYAGHVGSQGLPDALTIS